MINIKIRYFVAIVLVVLLGTGVLLVMPEKVTQLFADPPDPFMVSHQECVNAGVETCVRANTPGGTLREGILVMQLHEQIVLDANHWDENMLDKEIPVGLYFRIKIYPDPFMVSKQKCLDQDWMKKMCVTTTKESHGVFPLQQVIDSRKTTIEHLRLINDWGEEVTSKTLVPVGSTLAIPGTDM